MDELHQWWEVPSIGQFVSLFRYALNLPQMDIEELEESLIHDGLFGGSILLQDLIVSLLRGCCQHVTLSNWESHFRKVIDTSWTLLKDRGNPLSDKAKFCELDLRTKVDLIYFLCLRRLDCYDIADIMKDLDADALRVQSLGSDNEGNVYWYFYGTRLYREEQSPEAKNKVQWATEWEEEIKKFQQKRKRGRPRKRPLSDSETDSRNGRGNNCLMLDSKSRWSVVCTTLDEWKAFSEKFKRSKKKCEISLYSIITNNFLPALGSLYREKESRGFRTISAYKPCTPSVKPTDEDEIGNPEAPGSLTPRIKAKRARDNKKLQHLDRKQELQKEKAVEPQNVTSDNSEGHSSDSRESTIILDLYSKLEKVITAIKIHQDAWPFLNPVDEKVAPGYYDVIEDPIDLSFIERKIEQKEYCSINQVDRDFLKMVANSRLYNGEKSDFTIMAKNVWRAFRKGMTQASSSVNGSSRLKRKRGKSNSPECTAIQEKSSHSSDSDSKGKKKKSNVNVMQGLEMLAVASEQALKDVNKSEIQSFSPKSQENGNSSPSGLKKASSPNNSGQIAYKFDGHSYSPENSALISGHGGNSPLTSDSIVYGMGDCSPGSRKYLNNFQPIYSSSVTDGSHLFRSIAHSKYYENDASKESPKRLSPDSSIVEPPVSDSARSLQELEDTCRMLGITNSITQSDAISNLSSLICKIIRENQELQNESGIGSNDELSDVPNARLSISPEYRSVSSNSPHSTQGLFQVLPFNHSVPIIPTQLDVHNDFNIPSFTTVDASELGLTSNQASKKTPEPKEMPSRNAVEDDSTNPPVLYREDSNDLSLANVPQMHFSSNSPKVLMELPVAKVAAEDQALLPSNIATVLPIPNEEPSKTPNRSMELFNCNPVQEPKQTKSPVDNGAPNPFLPQVASLPYQVVNNPSCTSSSAYSNMMANSQPTYISSGISDDGSSLNLGLQEFSVTRPSTLPFTTPMPLQLPLPNRTLPYVVNQDTLPLNYSLASAHGQITLMPSASQYHSPTATSSVSSTSCQSPSHSVSSDFKLRQVKSTAKGTRKRRTTVKNHMPYSTPVQSGHPNLNVTYCLPASQGQGALTNHFVPMHNPQDGLLNSSSEYSAFVPTANGQFRPAGIPEMSQFLSGKDRQLLNGSMIHCLPHPFLLQPGISRYPEATVRNNFPMMPSEYRPPMHQLNSALPATQVKPGEQEQDTQKSTKSDDASMSNSFLTLPIKNGYPTFPIFCSSNIAQPALNSAAPHQGSSSVQLQMPQPLRITDGFMHSYILQNSVPNQQLFHPSFLNLPPHYVMSSQPTLVSPTQMQVPSSPQHGMSEIYMNGASESQKSLNKSMPVYTILQNARQ